MGETDYVLKSDALQQWRAAALREVELPTGTRVQVRVPDAQALVRGNVIPGELREIALKFATSGIELEKLTEEQILGFIAFTHQLVARGLRGLWTGDGWQPLDLTAEALDALELPEEDLEALTHIVLRRTTVNQVTAASRADRGLISDDVAQQVAADEAGDTVPGWASFRGQSGGAGDGAGSGDVAPAAVPAAADR